MIKLVEKNLKAFNHFPNSEDLYDYYFSHPDYPSLYALTDTLDFFEIENIAVSVSKDEFDNLPDQFLTLYHTDRGNEFVWVTQKNLSNIVYTDERNNDYSVIKSEFLSNWRQIIVAIEENTKPIEKKTYHSKNNWISILVMATLVLFFSVMVFKATAVEMVYGLLALSELGSGVFIALVYGFLALSGLALSILIVQENYGISNEITSKICGVTDSDKGGCNTVLNSQGAKIYKNYTFSDVCLVFFSTLSFLSLSQPSNNYFYIPVSLAAAPIIIYSVYYQKIKIKKWCALCLAVSGILTGIIATTLFAFSDFNSQYILTSTTFFVLTLSLFTTVWIVLKPFISGYFELKKSDRDNKRFKRNPKTFKTLLGATPPINTATLDLLPKIEIGNKSAITNLALFLSPSCGHCHTAFQDAYKLYEKHKDILKLSIYFNVNVENNENPYIFIVETILEAYNSNGPEAALNLLKEWHINKVPLEEFRKKYATEASDATKQALLAHFNWCDENNFNYSPVKLFDQKLMPNEYSLEDLQFFIKEFDEQ